METMKEWEYLEAICRKNNKRKGYIKQREIADKADVEFWEREN